MWDRSRTSIPQITWSRLPARSRIFTLKPCWAPAKRAGATGRLRTFDFSFNLTDTYTFWSGILGGTFLMLSYFGVTFVHEIILGRA